MPPCHRREDGNGASGFCPPPSSPGQEGRRPEDCWTSQCVSFAPRGRLCPGHTAALCGRGQLRPAQQLPGETSAVGLEPPVSWTVPENPRTWLWAGRGQASPGPAPRHWSAPWSRRSWGPLPSEASARRPFCSHSPTSPGSARERPREGGPQQRRRRAFTTGSGAENPGQDWKTAGPWTP